MGKQKIISSQKVFSAELFDIFEEKLSAGDTTYTFNTAYVQPTAAVVPITPKGEIYLINEYRYLFGKPILGIIAGGIDKGETSLQAAKRELKEEGGMEAGQWELLTKMVPMRNIIKHEMYLFLAKDLEISTQELQNEEEIEVVKMPLAEAVKKVMDGEIFHSPSMTAILLLDKLRSLKRL